MSGVHASKILKTGTWSAAVKVVLRSTIAVGGTVRAASTALGRSKASVEAMAFEMGLRSMQRIPGPTRERIKDLVSEGWAASRIAKRLSVSEDVVAFYSEKTSA